MVTSEINGNVKEKKAPSFAEILSMPIPPKDVYDRAVDEVIAWLDTYVVENFGVLASDERSWDIAYKVGEVHIQRAYPSEFHEDLTDFLGGRLEKTRLAVGWIDRSDALKKKMYETRTLPYDKLGLRY